MIKKILLLILFLCSPVLGQWQNGLKPMMGQQIDWSNPLSKGLVGYWPMNEGTGNIVQDLSGNGHVGTLVGNTHWVAGSHGPCLSFDGDNDWVDIATSLGGFGTEDFTIIAGVYAAWPGNQIIISRGAADAGSIQLYQSTSERLTVYGDSGSISLNHPSANSWPQNTWFQAAVTRTGSLITLYQDAVNIATDATGGASINHAAPWRIGANSSGANDYTGLINYLYIYNRALSAGEVADHYANPFGMFRPTFSVWWYSGIGGEPPVTFGQVIMISN